MSTMVRSPIDPRTLVLVVDEDRPIREMVRLALEVGSYLVWALDSGQNSVDALLAEYGPCVVLLDLMMPGVSGWDVCTQLTRELRIRHYPAIAMSAGLLKGDKPPTYAQALLCKPFGLGQLYAGVARFQPQALAC